MVQLELNTQQMTLWVQAEKPLVAQPPEARFESMEAKHAEGMLTLNIRTQMILKTEVPPEQQQQLPQQPQQEALQEAELHEEQEDVPMLYQQGGP